MHERPRLAASCMAEARRTGLYRTGLKVVLEQGAHGLQGLRKSCVCVFLALHKGNMCHAILLPAGTQQYGGLASDQACLCHSLCASGKLKNPCCACRSRPAGLTGVRQLSLGSSAGRAIIRGTASTERSCVTQVSRLGLQPGDGHAHARKRDSLASLSYAWHTNRGMKWSLQPLHAATLTHMLR